MNEQELCEAFEKAYNLCKYYRERCETLEKLCEVKDEKLRLVKELHFLECYHRSEN